MTINLTVIMEEESLNIDLSVGSLCSILLEIDNTRIIINPGGSPTTYISNMYKIFNNVNIVKNIDAILITNKIPRYWSSIRCILEMLNGKEVTIFIPSNSTRLLRYLHNIKVKMSKNFNIKIVRSREKTNNVEIINVRSPTYSELVLCIEGRILISTPAFWMLTNFDIVSTVMSYVREDGEYVGGIPLPMIDILRDYVNILKLITRKFNKIYLGHYHSKSVRRFISNLPIDVRILRCGSRFLL